MSQLLYIDENRVKFLLNWDETIKAVEAALVANKRKNAVQNPRSITSINSNNLLLTMPGYLNDEKYGALGSKLVTCFEGNYKREHPLPNILANIALFDEDTGILKAVRNAL